MQRYCKRFYHLNVKSPLIHPLRRGVATLYNVVISVVTSFSVMSRGKYEEMSRIVKYVSYS
jgi:hypothetical protein